MRYTHFPTPWDEHSSSQRVRFYTVLSSGGMRLKSIFFFLEESVRDVLFSQKYIYFWELYVSGNYKRLDLTS